MNNAVIRLKDGRYFGGWGKLGIMTFIWEKEYANRMSRTLAQRTLPKVEKEARQEASIESLKNVI